MPAADVVLLPLCVGLTLLGVIAVVVAWRRGNKGRVVQALGWALAPVALYFSGLLTLIWNGVSALVGWAGRLVFSPPVWFGLSLLAVCVLLIGVGGIVARRTAGRPAVKAAKSERALPAQRAGTQKAATTQAAPSKRGAPAQQQPVDEDMAEIEAILKNRGIN